MGNLTTAKNCHVKRNSSNLNSMTTKTVILAGSAAGNWGPSAEELGCAPTLTSASPQSQFSPGKGRWSRAVPCGIQSQQTHSTHQYEFWKYQLYTLIEYKDHHCHHRRPCQPMSQACVCLNMHKCCSSLRSYFCISSRFKVKGVTTYPLPHDQHHCSGAAGHRIRFLSPYT